MEPALKGKLLMTQRIITGFFLLIFVLLPFGASAGLLPALDTSNPYATMRSFNQEKQRIATLYEAYRSNPSDHSQRALIIAVRRAADQLLDMSNVPPATQTKVGARSLIELADIFLRLPDIAVETIPGAPEQASTPIPSRWTIPGTELRIERVSQGDAPPDFRFSAATVARLGEYHLAIIDHPPLRPAMLTHWRRAQIEIAGPLVPQRMIDNLPQWLRRPILEAATWKILCSITVFALALFLVFMWLRRIRRVTRGAAQIPRIMRWLTVPAILALSISLSHYAIDRQINLTGLLSDLESLATRLLLYVAVAWATALTCRLMAEAIIASPRIPDDGYDAHLLRLLARISGFISGATILVYGANDLGLPVLGVVAGLGVGSLALALASQSTVENLLGGVAIFADRPFRVRDAIRFNDLNGVVESIGPRSTRIRATDGTLTTVPNADIARAYVNNLSARRNFLFEHRVNLPAGANVAQTIGLLAALRKLLEEHHAIEKSGGLPHVRLTALEHDVGAIHLFAHVAVRNEEEFLQIQEDLLLRVMELLADDTTIKAA